MSEHHLTKVVINNFAALLVLYLKADVFKREFRSYLIKNGLGFINIDYNFKDELNKCLLELYEWNDSYSLKEFIKNKCYYAK